MFSMQCRKNITVENNTKRMNIANFKIYIQIYIYQYYTFKISIFDPVSQLVQMKGSYHLLTNKD